MTIQNTSFDDPKTWDLLAHGKTSGVFQIESHIYTDAISKLNSINFNTLIDLMALMRPGCTDSKTDDLYIKRANGQVPIAYEHPLLEPIISKSKGIILFQEDCLAIAHKLAGYTLAHADLFRKAISSKKEEMLEKERGKFIEGCKSHSNIPADTAEKIFNQIVTFAGYAFNKSHSVCYALISYWTGFLKANYTIEYMASLLSSQSKEEDIRKYIRESRDLGLKIGTPDINESESGFSVVDDKTIIFGLSKIKGIGEGAALHIIQKRPYKGFLDFVQKIDKQIIDTRLIETLVKAGCFRKSDPTLTTKQILENLESVIALFKTKKYISPMNAAKQNFIIWEKINRKQNIPLEYSLLELAHKERQTMGFYISTHPIKHLPDQNSLKSPKYRPLAQFETATQDFFTVGVLTDKVRSRKSRRGTVFHEIEIEDENSIHKMPVFGSNHDEVLTALAAGDIVAIKMKKSKNRFFLEKIKKVDLTVLGV